MKIYSRFSDTYAYNSIPQKTCISATDGLTTKTWRRLLKGGPRTEPGHQTDYFDCFHSVPADYIFIIQI